MAEVITVKISKGGVGKTTIVSNLGHTLSKKGFKVLLIDLDPQSNLSRLFIHEKPKTLSTSNLITEAIEDPKKLIVNVDTNLDLIRSDIGLVDAVKFLLEQFPEEYHLALQGQLEDLGFLEKYDFIILDMSPGVADDITNIAFVASNTLIAPINYEKQSLQGLTETVLHVHKLNESGTSSLDIEDIIVVPNRYDKRTTKINGDVGTMLKDHLSFGTVSDPIRENSNFKNSYSKDMTAISYEELEDNKYGHKKATEDFHNLADLIIKRGKN